MRPIILIGHGSFASALSSSLKMIVGENAPILAIDDGQELAFESIVQLGDFLAQNALIACDLLGGSPFLRIAEWTQGKHPIVCGINVPFALEYMLSEKSIEELLIQEELNVIRFNATNKVTEITEGGI